ncbi:MAG: POTRA domain-containing protein, partial [SAR324 cluster bacterium]|nr:POTRA domain-containing protein [SAR324 cluster bacterium]
MAQVIQSLPLKLKLLLLAFLLMSGFFQGFTAHELNAQNPSQAIHSIEIEGTSDLEKAQILYMIESQVGEALDQRKLRQDIHILHDMNLFRDVQVEVETGEDGFLLRYVVTERARLADV